jgi:O-antigen/teichoic acid export membrane protein
MIDALALGGRRLRSWLTSSGISGETEAERSSERNRRALANAIGGLALRGSSFAVVLVSVPLTLGYLGPTRFGLWMTLASLVALFGAMDLGIGNGVLNNVAQAFGQGDSAAARRYLASGFVALAGIGAGFGVLFLVVYPIVPWAGLYNVSADPAAASEAGPATAAFVATFLLGLPLGAAGAVRSAYQEGFVQSVFVGLGNAATLVLLLLAIAARATLPTLVLAMTTGPIIAAAVNLVVLVRFQRPWLAPARSDVTVAAMKSVVGVGLAFMVLQIAYAVAFSTDRLIIAQVVGPVAVAEYSVVYRLFSIPAGLAAIAIVPLWPAYREAIARSDFRWIRLMLPRSISAVLVATIPLAVLLWVAGPGIVAVWTGGELTPTYGLYPALAAFTVAFGVASAFSVFLNGAQALRFQITIWILMSVLNVALSVFLVSRIGVAGVAVGSLVATVGVLIVPAALYVPRLLHRLERLHRLELDQIAAEAERAPVS